MQKMRFFAVLFAVCAFALPALAQKATETKISGLVKGRPAGTSFQLANREGVFSVNASRASVRRNRRSFSLDKLTGGSSVTVTGTLRGKSMSASQVEVNFVNGEQNVGASKTPPKSSPRAGGKPREELSINPRGKDISKEKPSTTRATAQTGSTSSGAATKSDRNAASKSSKTSASAEPKSGRKLSSKSSTAASTSSKSGKAEAASSTGSSAKEKSTKKSSKGKSKPKGEVESGGTGATTKSGG